jgi:beta-lactamase regulating signal transducer with metallopeptidase domain
MNGFMSLWNTPYGEQIRGTAEAGLMWATEAALAAIPLAAVVACVNLFCRRWISAGQMGLLWCLVFFRLLLPAAPASPLSLHNLLPQDNSPVFLLPQENPATIDAAYDHADQHMVQRAAVVLPAPRPVLLDPVLVNPDVLAVESDASLDAVTAMTELVWLAAAFGIVSWTLFVNWRFSRSVRRTPACDDAQLLRLWKECCKRARIRKRLPVVVFDGVDQPAVMGLFPAKLLLPPESLNLSDDELQMIMLHELAHVRRRDIAINWGLALLRALHWWNPIYWLAASRFQSLREQACDAFVIRVLDGQVSRDYGELLLNLAAKTPPARGWRVMVPASLLGFLRAFFRKRDLRLRLKALRWAGARHGRWHAAAIGAVVAAAALCGLTDAQTPAPQIVDAFDFERSYPKGTDWRTWVVAPEDENLGLPLETRPYAIDEIISRIPADRLGDEPSRGHFIWLVEMMLKRSPKSSDEGKDESCAVDRESPLRANYHWEENLLVVRAPAKVHDELSTVINAWQTSGIAQICIECRMMTVAHELATAAGIELKTFGAVPAMREEEFPPANFQPGTVVRASSQVEDHAPVFVVPLTERQVKRITEIVQADARANLMFAPKVTLFNGQKALVSDAVQRPFVVGLEKQPSQAIKPRVEVVEEGTKISLRTVLKADRQHIQLTGLIDLTSIIDVGVASASAVGENLVVQVPRVSRRRISVASEIVDGDSLMVGWPPSFDRKDYFYVLLTVRHIVLPQE